MPSPCSLLFAFYTSGVVVAVVVATSCSAVDVAVLVAVEVATVSAVEVAVLVAVVVAVATGTEAG